jgi:phosphoribosylformylglycinamidine synthase PurS subunit
MAPSFREEGGELMRYGAEILVYLKEGVLDTQGKAVAASLTRLGYDDPSVRVGKYIRVEIEASDMDSAKETFDKMCKDLLVNAIVEDYTVKVEELR